MTNTVRTFVTRKPSFRPVFEARVSVKGRVVFKCHYGTREMAELACQTVSAKYAA